MISDGALNSDHAGWHSRGYIPHFDSPDRVQHIVFRLADALPVAVMAAIQERDPSEQSKATAGALMRGHGARLLAHAETAGIVQAALLHFDGCRYRLLGWCVMPTHVHAIVAQMQGYPLSGIVHSWKSYTAKTINARLGRSGFLWSPDYFDRFMRDEAHLERTIAYVENNPVAAGLCKVAEDWRFSSAYVRRSAS